MIILPKQHKYKKICFQKWPANFQPLPHLWHPELQSPEGCHRCGSEGLHLIGDLHLQKDRSIQVSKYSPWGTDVKPFPSLQKKMLEFLGQRRSSPPLYQ